jgi:hypothetical protein
MTLRRKRYSLLVSSFALLFAASLCLVLAGNAQAEVVTPDTSIGGGIVAPEASDEGEIYFSPTSTYPGGTVNFGALTKWFNINPMVPAPAGMYIRMSLFGNRPIKTGGNAPNSTWVTGYDADYGGNCWKYSSGWMWYYGRYDLEYYGQYQIKSTTPHNVWTNHLVGANEMWDPDDWYWGYLYVR